MGSLSASPVGDSRESPGLAEGADRNLVRFTIRGCPGRCVRLGSRQRPVDPGTTWGTNWRATVPIMTTAPPDIPAIRQVTGYEQSSVRTTDQKVGGEVPEH
jgi:hypothetical protein